MIIALFINLTLGTFCLITVSSYRLNNGGIKISSNHEFFHQRRTSYSTTTNNNVHKSNFHVQLPITYKTCRQRKSSLSMTSVLSPKVVSEMLLPQHELLVQGKLDNGFSYVILPNAVPPGKFEAHLEVLSGSAHELESQVISPGILNNKYKFSI